MTLFLALLLKKKIDRDTKLALLLLKGGMRGKELKKHFPETFAKMSNGRWQRVYSKLKKEVNKKIDELSQETDAMLDGQEW